MFVKVEVINRVVTFRFRSYKGFANHTVNSAPYSLVASIQPHAKITAMMQFEAKHMLVFVFAIGDPDDRPDSADAADFVSAGKARNGSPILRVIFRHGDTVAFC